LPANAPDALVYGSLRCFVNASGAGGVYFDAWLILCSK
jgi:hypothetical protein